MTKILGKDVSLSIVTSGSPQEIELIGCATECSLVTNMDILPSSTAGSGKYKEFTGISINWNGSITGFATVGQNMDMQTLTGMQFSLQPVILSFKEVGPAGDIYYSGYALITAVSRTGNFGNAETYQIGFQGSGELLLDAIVYGNTPTGLNSIFADDQLVIVWTPVSPAPDYYILQVIDLTTNSTTYYNNIPNTDFDGYGISITGDRYEIHVQADYGALGKSLFSPAIYYP